MAALEIMQFYNVATMLAKYYCNIVIYIYLQCYCDVLEMLKIMQFDKIVATLLHVI